MLLPDADTVPLRINRIRLEFKVPAFSSDSARLCVLIESDWNLKSSLLAYVFIAIVVLIESDWNLKTTFALGFQIDGDTY